jgi:hypothetical protein
LYLIKWFLLHIIIGNSDLTKIILRNYFFLISENAKEVNSILDLRSLFWRWSFRSNCQAFSFILCIYLKLVDWLGKALVFWKFRLWYSFLFRWKAHGLIRFFYSHYWPVACLSCIDTLFLYLWVFYLVTDQTNSLVF